MTAVSTERVRTYGGWRPARGMGLWGLGPTETMIVMGCVVVPMVVAAVDFRTGLLAALPALVVAGLTAARWDGVSIGSAIAARFRFARARRAGWTAYRGGVVSEHPSAFRLPGLLAASALVDAEDFGGRRVGLVLDQRTGMLTATLRCAAHSTRLMSAEDVDVWVSAWHQWLASLGHEPMVSHVAVTVDMAPEPGTTLRDGVEARLDPAAPADAVELLRDLAVLSPSAAADVETRVSITFDPSRADRKLEDLSEQAGEVLRRLDGLQASLAGCGVSVTGRATPAQLAGMVRVAYDPSVRGDVASVLARDPNADELLTWDQAGPVAADEAWDHYRHDTAWSATLGWREAPRQQVVSSVLEPLLRPGKHPTRVTILYRPLSASASARLLENQVNAATFRTELAARQKRDATARDLADHEAASQAAREEAHGAGVVQFAVYATTTAPSRDELDEAVSALRQAGDKARMQLRPMAGCQQAGFQTTLPCGVNPVAAAAKALR